MEGEETMHHLNVHEHTYQNWESGADQLNVKSKYMFYCIHNLLMYFEFLKTSF